MNSELLRHQIRYLEHNHLARSVLEAHADVHLLPVLGAKHQVVQTDLVPGLQRLYEEAGLRPGLTNTLQL